MGKAIFLTVLIFGLLSVVNIVTDVVEYNITQEYAAAAPDQLNNDEAYSVMRTQEKVMKLYQGAETLIYLLGLFLIGLVWFKYYKKRTKPVEGINNNNYKQKE